MKFEWDSNKAESNQRKHGIYFEEASTIFADVLSITIPDPLHPAAENRYIIIGRSDKQRLLIVVHIEEAEDNIRLISARKATAHERKRYESYE